MCAVMKRTISAINSTDEHDINPGGRRAQPTPKPCAADGGRGREEYEQRYPLHESHGLEQD